MKRYYIAPAAEMPTNAFVCHGIDLGSHGSAGTGYCAVVVDSNEAPHAAIPPTWEQLPHVLDPNGKVKASHAAVLKDVGIDVTHSGFQAAMKLAAIHRQFAP